MEVDAYCETCACKLRWKHLDDDKVLKCPQCKAEFPNLDSQYWQSQLNPKQVSLEEARKLVKESF